MRINKLLFLILICCLVSQYSFGQNFISGVTWIDADQNGVRSTNEIIVPNVNIELYNEAGMIVQFGSSDDQGAFSFDNLGNGEFYMNFIKPQGLKLTLRSVGDPNFDSDIFQTGFSDLINLSNNNSNVSLDAGFRTSISINTSSLIESCFGNTRQITPIVNGFSGNLTYHWSHDNSTDPSTTIVLDSTLDIIFTVQDEWNLPVSKKILIKVVDDLGLTTCERVDFFDDQNTVVDLMATKANPGPVSQIDNGPNFFGGLRTVTFELLAGDNISTVNTTNENLFISNCAGCRTRTVFNYSAPSGDFLDLSFFEFLSFSDLLLDQGNIDLLITLNGETEIATLEDRLESEGASTEFDKIFYFSNFSNAAQIDLSRIRSMEIELITTDISIDFKLDNISFCFDKACDIDLQGIHEICESQSITLSPDSECESGLIYQWQDLGFGREKTVSPTDTTTYILTVYDQVGCSRTFETTVNVTYPPVLQINAPLEVCNTEEAEVMVLANGNGPFTYEWNITNQDTSSFSYTVLDNTFISVTVTDSNGCTANTQQVITVLENPSISLSTTPSMCSSPTGTVSAEITGGLAPYTINWSNGSNDTNSLSDVDGGQYIIEVIDANGCTTLDTATVDFLPCAQIGNYVWHDVDLDGIQGGNDIPIMGAIVILLDQQSQELLRDTTDEFGHYLFKDLEAGDYYVAFEPPSGFYPTIKEGTQDTMLDSNIDSTSLVTDLITLVEFEKNLTIDAGWFKKVCIGNQVWNDLNNNNTFDSLDIGIEDVLVKLYDCNQSVIDSMLTDNDGMYQFCDLNPGSYSLTFCDYEGYIPVIPNVGDETVDSDIDPLSSSTACKTIMSGDTLNDCDAGFVLYSSIGDYVWHDLNADGIQDNNEPPLGGVGLSLYTCDSTFIDMVSTNDQGFYLFDSLMPGNYFVEISPLPNSILTNSNAGVDTLDSDFLSTSNTTTCIDLPADTDITDVDGGLYYLSSIGDYAWIDLNVDGIQEAGEEDLEGLKVYLWDCANTLLDSTFTNQDGYYRFDDLVPNAYYISVKLEDGQAITTNTNTNNVINNDIDPVSMSSACTVLTSGEYNPNLDIGIYYLGKIGDFVWYDTNGNGIQEIGENGVPNVPVTLLNCNDEVISTVETNQDGNYCFQNLPYGDYVVEFDVPEPYFLVSNNEGSNNAIDSDPNLSSNATDCITVDSPINITIDAGITTCSKIGGTAWFEIVNMNHIQDPTENGVNGVKVNVYQNQGGSWVLIGYTFAGHKPGTPSDDGYWEMCVAPGEYYVEFSNVSVLEAVEANVGNDEEVDSDATHLFGINTTDVITVLPAEDKTDIGIGYKWKITNNGFTNFTSREDLPVVSRIENDIPVFTNDITFDQPTKKVNHSIIAHPNPTIDMVYLTSTFQGKITYSLLDNAGNVLRHSISVNTKLDKRIEISLGNEVSGMYYLLVQSLDNTQIIPIIKMD